MNDRDIIIAKLKDIQLKVDTKLSYETIDVSGLVDLVLHAVSQIDKLTEEQKIYKGNAESVRRVCEDAGIPTTFKPSGIPRDLADPVRDLVALCHQGSFCWCIELNDKFAIESGLRFFSVTGYDRVADDIRGPFWVADFDEALKFHDRESAEKLCADMPDDWDVRIIQHGIAPAIQPYEPDGSLSFCPNCGSDMIEQTTEGRIYLPGSKELRQQGSWWCHRCGLKGGAGRPMVFPDVKKGGRG